MRSAVLALLLMASPAVGLGLSPEAGDTAPSQETPLIEFAAPAFAVGVDSGGAGAASPERCGCFPYCACDSDCRANASNGVCACYWDPGELCCWDSCDYAWWGSCACH